MSKLTDWFPPGTKPARKGIYEVNDDGWIGYQYWNGQWWCSFECTASDAFRYRKSKSIFQDSKWRGLAAPK